MFRAFLFLLILSAFPDALRAASLPLAFTRLDASDGLSDNSVMHILQLPDGRMVFTTQGNINLYDGMRFHYIHRNDSDLHPLRHYHGAYHVYVGDNDRLWIKNYKHMWCLDLRHERYLTHPEEVFRDMGLAEEVTDLFADSEHGLWLVTERGLWDGRRKKYLPQTTFNGDLQDVETADSLVYLFFSSGELTCHSRRDGRFLYRSAAYPADEQADYDRTSLVVKGPDGNFYQIRAGRKAALFSFSPATRRWRRLLTADGNLHTLIVPSARTACISSLNGIWEIDLPDGQATFRSALMTADGEQLQTSINTIYRDRDRGIWLGTNNHGILYAHPERLRFASAASPEALSLTSADVEEALRQKNDRRKDYQDYRYNDVLTDSHRRKWCATADGLRLFLSAHAEPRMFYTEDGLPNNFIHAFTEDAQGRIWASTSCGISQISLSPGSDTPSFTNYRHEDGLLKGEYGNRKACTLTDGRILMGGTEGWTLFHPDSAEVPLRQFRPLLIGLSLYGTPLSIARAGSTAPRRSLAQAAPYLSHYEFSYRENHIGMDFSALNYVCPAQTHYRYRLIHGNDSTWYEASLASGSNLVDERGNLHLSFPLLPPGRYRLQVTASTRNDFRNSPVTEVSFVIHAPWWLTPWAYTAYLAALLLTAALGIHLYIRQTRRRILRRHKEDILLLRIQHLIERCDSYERLCRTPSETSTPPQEKEEPPICSADSEFLNKAVALVEANLNTPGYSVERLSKDLCMERSGLYKKLTNLLDKSPSLFIRSIRLKRAADMIAQGGMSMNEIAERVGFSSASYMSRCFQEEYGCKPSEYMGNMKKST